MLLFTRFQPVGICQVRALYDCAADEAGDLAFGVGDVITVLAKDEGCLKFALLSLIHTHVESGWWTGTAHGNTGIFPASYVVQLMTDV